MSGNVAVFFGGIRLRDNVMGFWPTGQTTADGFAAGLLRAYGTVNPESANVRIDVEIATELAPVAARSDLSRIEATEIDLAMLERDLFRLTKTGLQHLTRVPDDTRVAAVTGGPHSPGSVAVPHGTPGGSWTPTAGRYLLARNAATGAGFAAAITAVGAGTATFVIPAGYSLTTAWTLLDASIYYPSTHFLRMSKGSPPAGDPAAGFWRPDVRYFLLSVGEPVIATAHVPPTI